jgi:prepilin-type N-terminal cleavage/methylation domain-containing protein
MKHKKRAFTLVELLVVIGIIAVLIAILMPALAAARQSAQRASCLSNLRQIGIGVFAYLAEYNGTMPLQAYIGFTDNTHNTWSYSDAMGFDPTHNNEPYSILAYLDFEYLKDKNTFICPAADPTNFFDPNYPYDWRSSCYGDADLGCGSAAVFSYAQPVDGSSYPNIYYDTWVKANQITNPSGRLMIADKGGLMYTDNTTNNWQDIRPTEYGFLYTDGGVDNSGRHGGGPAPTVNHPASTALVNFVCVDGHGETSTYTDIQQPTEFYPNSYNWMGGN